LAALSNGVVTRAVFGGRLSQREDFIHAADDIMDMLGGIFLVDMFPSSRLVRWLSNEERRVKSCRDVIQGIITNVVGSSPSARRCKLPVTVPATRAFWTGC
jgi:hypothetical protein